MKKALILSMFAASVVVAGCETPQTNAAAQKAEGDVITGSRIPRKGGSDGAVGTVGGEAYKQGQIERSGNTGMKGN